MRSGRAEGLAAGEDRTCGSPNSNPTRINVWRCQHIGGNLEQATAGRRASIEASASFAAGHLSSE